jgi:GH35 family endo-1,4-beta-xylanase
MKKTLLTTALFVVAVAMQAQNTVIDIRDGNGDNTDKSYITYDKAISVASGKTTDVKLARYCYLNSTVSGKGTINLYVGGERCWLGTKSAWANWTNFKGAARVYSFKENSSKAGAFLLVLNHGGKVFSPEKIEECVKDGKLNNALQNCALTVHSGAGVCNEANNANAGGFRIGELQMEAGSTLQGYMKTGRASYYLVGGLNTDGVLAGTIAPSSYNDGTLLGLIKEGTGTYRITGNNNYLTGCLRVIGGRLLVNNDRAQAETQKLRGGLGAKTSESEAIAYVFGKGILGGTGSIGGAVDNYGTIEPGDDTPGTLTLKNYVSTTKNANLTVHPASVLRFKVASADSFDRLNVAGAVKFSNTTEDFSTSDAAPVITLALDELPFKVGTEITLLTAKSKTGDWQFALQQPGKGTWALEEKTGDDGYQLVVTLVSTEDADPDNPDGPDNPDIPESTMGPFYDDGIDDNKDTKTLRYYAEKNDKKIGVALCTYKGLDSDRTEAAKQFNMMVAENEMKMDALQPSQGQFSYGAADGLVSLAQTNTMAIRGHCLVWHTQQPTWLSSDGKKNDKGWTRQQALDIMKNHITKVMQHFKGKVTEWDVVNECLDDDQSIIRTKPEGYKLRPTVWQLAIGDDYIDSAFVYARRAVPTAELYLNDYDVEMQGKAKAVAFYNLVKHLQDRQIPLDGVGLQCHFSVGDVDSVKLEQTIRRFGEANLKCIITELDMGISSTSAKELEEQARNYRVITDIVLNNDNCPNLVIWGIKDNDSWRSASNPLLYTSGLGKKKAWYAVRSALRHRFLEKEQTGIKPFSPSRVKDDNVVYDLSGRRVNVESLRPGVYIKAGKKISIN